MEGLPENLPGSYPVACTTTSLRRLGEHSIGFVCVYIYICIYIYVFIGGLKIGVYIVYIGVFCVFVGLEFYDIFL